MDFIELSRKYSDVADFVAVYVAEAHASNEWKLDVNDSQVRHYP